MNFDVNIYRDGGTIELLVDIPMSVLENFFSEREIKEYITGEMCQFTIPPIGSQPDISELRPTVYLGWWNHDTSLQLYPPKHGPLIAWVISKLKDKLKSEKKLLKSFENFV